MRPLPLGIAVVLAATSSVISALVVAGVPARLALGHAVVVAANAAMGGHDGLITAAKAVTDAGGPVSVDVLTGVAAVALLLRRGVRVRGAVETGLKWII